MALSSERWAKKGRGEPPIAQEGRRRRGETESSTRRVEGNDGLAPPGRALPPGLARAQPYRPLFSLRSIQGINNLMLLILPRRNTHVESTISSLESIFSNNEVAFHRINAATNRLMYFFFFFFNGIIAAE